MPDGSEFPTAGVATLKQMEAKVVRTRGADNRLVFAERREHVGPSSVVIKKGVEVSRHECACVLSIAGHSFTKH